MIQDKEKQNSVVVKPLSDYTSTLDIISGYIEALQQRDSDKMDTFRSKDFIRDLVAGDAFHDSPSSNQDTREFWSAWFTAFEDMDYEVTRTIATKEIVVLEWVFTGTHSGTLDPAVFNKEIAPTGNTIKLRGVSIYEIAHKFITSETLYIDMATLWVELGVIL